MPEIKIFDALPEEEILAQMAEECVEASKAALKLRRVRTISALVSALKQVADLAGFEIVGRVVLMDKDSGRIFR